MQKSKVKIRMQRHQRVRTKIIGSAQRPRVAVFRSNKYISAQVIDDLKRVTIASESSAKNKPETASERLAKKLQAAGIRQVVFDRGGYQYHGNVKALAEGLRKAGITV